MVSANHVTQASRVCVCDVLPSLHKTKKARRKVRRHFLLASKEEDGSGFKFDRNQCAR